MDAQQLKDWLCEELEKRPDINKAELATALNLEPPAVSKILNGTRQVKAIEYVRILNFLGISANEQGLPDTGNDTESPRTANGWSIPQGITGRQKPQLPEGAHKTFCINDALMKPELLEGEHVMVDRTIKPNTERHPFLVSDGYNRMVRFCRLIPESRPKTIEITARSKTFEPQQLFERDFEVIGKVVAKLNWL